jgi:polygalacturonase
MHLFGFFSRHLKFFHPHSAASDLAYGLSFGFFTARYLLLVMCLGLLLSGTVLCSSETPSPGSGTKAPLNVRDFGAVGEGKVKDTEAFQKAMDTCARGGGGTVIVPRGVYLIGSIVMGSNTVLQIERGANLCGSPDIEDYPLGRVRWEGEFVQGHRALISADGAANVLIVGGGSIFGPPLALSRLRHPRGPLLLELSNCTNVVLEGFSTQYQQIWSVHLLYCQKVAVQNLTVRSINSNGDGIDIDSCRDVIITHCNIATGDDAISLKSGRGMEAVRIGRPTENVQIKDCSLVSSTFAGLGIGTEMSGGIRHVRLENCYISGRQNGIVFKSRDGRGGFIEDVVGENLTISSSGSFIAVDLIRKGIQASEPVSGAVEKWALVKNLSFTNVQVSAVETLVNATHVPPERPLDGFSLSGVTGTCVRGMELANMKNVALSDIKVTGFQGDLLTLENVQGKGLELATKKTQRD